MKDTSSIIIVPKKIIIRSIHHERYDLNLYENNNPTYLLVYCSVDLVKAYLF